MTNLERAAGQLYEVYCKAVGGVNFRDDPLPDWDTFRADESKRKQSDGWLAVAKTWLSLRVEP